MARQFKHLTQAQISEIIVSYNGGTGESKNAIARRLGVDHSTIHYHIEKYERSYPEQSNVYALVRIQARKVCIHPSSKCSVCGKHNDEIRREERALIADLTVKLEAAHTRLRRAGLPVE
jgi:IS30 family transposase